MASARRLTIEEIFAETDQEESDFEGFSDESDISIAASDPDSTSDESDEDEPVANTEWTSRFSEITVEDFTAVSGACLSEGFDVFTATPLDYFWLMFNTEMMVEMARHTNNYARWQMARSGTHDPYWIETTASEIRAFIGMEILMGVTPLPDACRYWSKDVYIGNLGIQAIMTVNRYQKLKQYFHVSDREAEPVRGQPGYDRLFKVRPILDHVSDTFLRNYTLGKCASIDEAMVKYTGKLSFKQFMPAKPIKRGIKVWMACDSTSSYLSRFQVYLGRNENAPEQGLGYNVVTKLTDNLHGSHRHIFFDNFFTSVPLLEDLHSNGLYACGTVRVNMKGFPKELKKPKDVKQRGNLRVLQKGESNSTASVWKDRKLVHTLSTLSRADDIVPVQRRVGPNMEVFLQPASISAYNQHMGGVDQHDQLRLNYGVGRNLRSGGGICFGFSSTVLW